MSETPNPLDKKALSRASIIGLGLAVTAIVMFIVLWVALGNAGVEQFSRLVMSLCIPPAVIAALLGIYMLIRPGDNNP